MCVILHHNLYTHPVSSKCPSNLSTQTCQFFKLKLNPRIPSICSCIRILPLDRDRYIRCNPQPSKIKTYNLTSIPRTHVVSMGKHVDRLNFLDCITTPSEQGQVPGQGGGITETYTILFGEEARFQPMSAGHF